MFEKLREKWKVSGLRLTLILITFALGGSLTGYVGKKIMNQFSIGSDWAWTLIYIFLVILLWPLAVLIVSAPFGQFAFFSAYIRKLGSRIGLGNNTTDNKLSMSKQTRTNNVNRPLIRVAIFASGAGSNAQKLIDHFRDHPFIRPALLVSNNPAAGVLNIARLEKIPTLLIEKERFFRGDGYIPLLEEKNIRFIVLAGFLWKLPPGLTSRFENRIVNIHPALLPKHGGKGMYGPNVHKAVISAGDRESGITVHYVDEVYDNGRIIFQTTCPVYEDDTVESLTQRIHLLEHEHYPRIVEEVIKETISS